MGKRGQTKGLRTDTLFRAQEREGISPGPTLITDTSLRPVPWHPTSRAAGRDHQGRDSQVYPPPLVGRGVEQTRKAREGPVLGDPGKKGRPREQLERPKSAEENSPVRPRPTLPHAALGRAVFPVRSSDWTSGRCALIGRVGEAEESRAQRRVWGRVQTSVWRRQGPS